MHLNRPWDLELNLKKKEMVHSHSLQTKIMLSCSDTKQDKSDKIAYVRVHSCGLIFICTELDQQFFLYTELE